MSLTRLLASAAMLVASVVAAIAIGGASAAAQDSGYEVLRIGWSQDAKTLNPFTGVNEEEYTIWALTGSCCSTSTPRRSSRAAASPRAGRSRRTARRSPST